jgi:hypothetical protein
MEYQRIMVDYSGVVFPVTGGVTGAGVSASLGGIGLVGGFGGASLPKNEIKKQRPRSILPIQKSSTAGEKTRIIPINLEQAEGQRFVDGEGRAST